MSSSEPINEPVVLNLDSWSKLTWVEQKVLGAIFHKHAGQPFSSLLPREQWAIEGLSVAEAKSSFTNLRQQRWIESVYKSWGERLFYIPASLMETLTIAYAQRVGITVKQMAQHAHVLQEGKPDIAAELLHLIAWIGREGLPLTSKGTIHKKSVQKLSVITVLSSTDFDGLGIRYEHSELYPTHVAILLDLLLSLNLVQKSDGRIQIQGHQLKKWLKLSWTQMHREIYQACMERYGEVEPALQHFRYQLAVLAPEKNIWCRIANSELKSRIMGWLYALAGWGYGEVGEDQSGYPAFRWLIDPQSLLYLEREMVSETEPSGFYMQPDFEMLVPPEARPDVIWMLEQCAERVTRDRMSIYRITRERFVSAIARGYGLHEMMEFLDQYALTSIPENVRIALEDWGRETDAATLTGERKMEVTKASTGSEDDPKLLEKDVLTGVYSASFYTPENQGLVDVPAFLHGLERDHSVIEKKFSLLRFEEIPETWYKEWRRYHSSTARQIAAKAIEWQTKLGIQQENRTQYLIPDQVEGHEQWTLSGWCMLDSNEHTSETEWRTFSPSEWDTMRLILPDDVIT
ncbi:helicase-associated domain-containing protein [Paenibacillus sp. 1781tsa1]|uniref:helicase-associated domain-containing protein n=1 Tax=Paenibacillus sp. 1781tsa1 TaxID=2953810 RepID=UPI0020A17272|nr:helicase-associated domain-containing protein [Paenibacillus sp. 1781tsa1]MCP1185607.1 helicase-associated domain-containing protein [Paenibacillus sp. 1781tsa1]